MAKMAPWITGLSCVRLWAADIVRRGVRMGGGAHRGKGNDSNSNDHSATSGMTTVFKQNVHEYR